MKHLWLIFVLLAVGCDAFTGHYDVREWPCGSPRWHSCGNGSCCPENTDCGGTAEYPGCPAGVCCANGGEDEGAPPWGDGWGRRQ